MEISKDTFYQTQEEAEKQWLIELITPQEDEVNVETKVLNGRTIHEITSEVVRRGGDLVIKHAN